MVQHAALTGAELHEPKGVDAASADTVYVADGAGSGTWQKVTNDQISSSKALMVMELRDIGTARDIYIPFTHDATIDAVSTAIDGALTVANAVITFYNSAAASMGIITITQAGSAAGDIDTNSSLANNTVVAGSFIRVNLDGGPGNSPNAVLMIEATWV